MQLVLKIGGELLNGSAATPAWAQDLRVLSDRGLGLSIVHGGGVQVTELQKRLGIEPEMIAGRRVTDESTLEVIKMAVAGIANVDLCALLIRAGLRPVGLHGASGPVLHSVRRPAQRIFGGPEAPVDLGLVGEVRGFDLVLLDRLTVEGYVPVLACLGCDPKTGAVFNINADRVSSALAVASRADKLILLTATPGVLGDPHDPTTRIAKLSRSQAETAVQSGRITRGMLAKLEEAFSALEQGVNEVQILGELGPGDLVGAIDSPGSVGTLLVP